MIIDLIIEDERRHVLRGIINEKTTHFGFQN